MSAPRHRPIALLVEADWSSDDQNVYATDIAPWRDLISKDFDLRVAVGRVDCSSEVQISMPDVVIFDSRIDLDSVENIEAFEGIPRVGLVMHSYEDVWRVKEFESLSALECDAFFSFENIALNCPPEFADRCYMVLRWLNSGPSSDLSQARTIPVGLYGSGFVNRDFRYPWRFKVAENVLGSFPCFSASEPYRFLQEGGHGELLKRSKIALICGSIARSLTSVHLEVCHSGAALFCQETLLMKSLGFRDGVNCIFVSADDVCQKISEYLSDEIALSALAERGYHFVSSHHALANRNQIIDWYRLHKRGLEEGQFIFQVDVLGPLEIVDQTEIGKKIEWDERNPVERILDSAYTMIWSGRFDESVSKIKPICDGLEHHLEGRICEALAMLCLGRLSSAIEMLQELRNFFLGYVGWNQNDILAEALFALSRILSGEDLQKIRDDVRLVHVAHPLVDIVSMLLGCEVISEGASDVDFKRNRIAAHYRLLASSERWRELIRGIFEVCGQLDTWRSLTDRGALSGSVELLADEAGGKEERIEIDQLEEQLRCSGSFDESWRVHQFALEREQSILAFRAARDAASLDRNFAPAYVAIGQALAEAGNLEEAYLCLMEAERLEAEDRSFVGLLNELRGKLPKGLESVRVYHDRVNASPSKVADRPMKVLAFTDGLLGREDEFVSSDFWELCEGLICRGHEVRILAADLPEPENGSCPSYERVKACVDRSLMAATGDEGVTGIEQGQRVGAQIALQNLKAAFVEIDGFRPDVCLAGNLQFIGSAMLNPILEKGIPILHRLGNARPGYMFDATPRSPLFCLAGCSRWVNEELKKSGYQAHNYAVLPYGAQLDDYYRLLPPKVDRLRICYAGPMMSDRGPQVLLRALEYLRQLKIPFSCEFAGDFKDPEFERIFKSRVTQFGLAEDVRLLGFCSCKQLGAMYARNNVLVMPSIFEEPFGEVQIEAQAAGLAVVRTPVGGYQDMIVDEVNGLLAKPNDPEDLARQLFVLKENHELWRKLGEQGQVDAFKFSTRNSVQILEEIFGELFDRAALFRGK